MIKLKALKGIGVTEKVTAKVTARVTEKVTETLMENEKVFLKILSDNPYAFMRIWSAGIPIQVRIKDILGINVYFCPSGQWNPCCKSINPNHIISKLREYFQSWI